VVIISFNLKSGLEPFENESIRIVRCTSQHAHLLKLLQPNISIILHFDEHSHLIVGGVLRAIRVTRHRLNSEGRKHLLKFDHRPEFLALNLLAVLKELAADDDSFGREVHLAVTVVDSHCFILLFILFVGVFPCCDYNLPRPPIQK